MSKKIKRNKNWILFSKINLLKKINQKVKQNNKIKINHIKKTKKLSIKNKCKMKRRSFYYSNQMLTNNNCKAIHQKNDNFSKIAKFSYKKKIRIKN